MAHTPGPWKVAGTGGTAVSPEWAPDERVCVTMAVNLQEDDEGSFPEVGQWQRADACLIAAAPELLAALKDCCDWLAAICDSNKLEATERGYLEAASNAIAKAEGRSE